MEIDICNAMFFFFFFLKKIQFVINHINACFKMWGLLFFVVWLKNFGKFDYWGNGLLLLIIIDDPIKLIQIICKES